LLNAALTRASSRVGRADASVKPGQGIAGETLTIIEGESIFRGIAAGCCDMYLGAPDRCYGRGSAHLVNGRTRGLATDKCVEIFFEIEPSTTHQDAARALSL
jgi:hypothetical protein